MYQPHHPLQLESRGPAGLPAHLRALHIAPNRLSLGHTVIVSNYLPEHNPEHISNRDPDHIPIDEPERCPNSDAIEITHPQPHQQPLWLPYRAPDVQQPNQQPFNLPIPAACLYWTLPRAERQPFIIALGIALSFPLGIAIYVAVTVTQCFPLDVAVCVPDCIPDCLTHGLPLCLTIKVAVGCAVRIAINIAVGVANNVAE